MLNKNRIFKSNDEDYYLLCSSLLFATYYLRLNYIEIVYAIICNFILYLTSLFVNHNSSNYSITCLHVLSNNVAHFLRFNEEIISRVDFFIQTIRRPWAMCQTSKPAQKKKTKEQINLCTYLNASQLL